MSNMKWIKLSTALFEDDKLLIIEQMEDGILVQLLWVKLLCLAGKHCRDGRLLMTEGRPYTPTMLATLLRMDKKLVRRGLDTLCAFGMLTLQEGAYVIKNWDRHQSMDAYLRKRNYDREYRSRQRAQNRKQETSSFLELVQEA